MLGVSERNIVDSEPTERMQRSVQEGDGVTISYNTVDPLVIRDGIDCVTVVKESEDRYIVTYRGFEFGQMRVNREGVRELGHSLLGNEDDVPRWLLDDSPDEERPWWVPDDYSDHFDIRCQHCGTETPPREILAPGISEGASEDRFCHDCWKEIGELWHPEKGLQEPSALEQARELRDLASSDPGAVDLGEISDLIDAEDTDVQKHALHALIDVIEDRPKATLSFVPVLTERLEGDDILVRCASLYCLADIASEYPRPAVPAADAVIELLDKDADEGILEGAIPYTAAVAEADPSAVRGAGPILAELLEKGTPCLQEAVFAMVQIAKAFPEDDLPVSDELLLYLDREENTAHVATLAALGYVSKDYPNVNEIAVTSLIEMLDVQSNRLRASAAGLLADLVDEYPQKIRPAVPRIVELLDDDDENARNHATSILANVAKVSPDAVEPATARLVDALDEDSDHVRLNAYWALGRVRAVSARAALQEVSRLDPNEEVRNVAAWAVREIDEADE